MRSSTPPTNPPLSSSGGNALLQPARYTFATWLLLRGIGLVYFIAFVSFWVQAEGLVGADGILPIQDYFSWLSQHAGLSRFWLVPSLLWLAPTNWMLHAVCAAGTVAAVAMVAGRYVRAALLFAWLGYLSLTSCGGTFMSYQWDVLLLETGFILLLFPPKERTPSPPPPLLLFLVRWLLFRLMFTSGVVKLSSGDPAWRSLEALSYHYFTQPLPAAASYFLYHAPPWFHAASTAAVLAIELITPWFIFGGRTLRRVAAGAFIMLQALIWLTGSYGFFNLLTIILTLSLIDDDALAPFLSRPFRRSVAAAPPTAPSPSLFRLAIQNPFVVMILVVSSAQMALRCGAGAVVPAAFESLAATFRPLRIANSYGLFAVMTTERREIILEHSDDLRHWTPYEFRWKPGALDEAPRRAAPHQPRLDWQMWFAALGPAEQSPWLAQLVRRLLEGSPAVEALLEPSTERPPRYIRALLYRYTLSSNFERTTSGDWWKRELLGLYLPPLSLDAFPRQARGRLTEK